MSGMPSDIFTEPDADPDTLRNLGPLARMAGSWLGQDGLDVHPTADGPVESAYIERYELEPIDPQTNGPQLFYGLRYHTRITQPGEVAMFHEQVGFWLWEPASGTVVLTLAIPRGQVAMATGQAGKDSRHFTLKATRGSQTNGIVTNPFLEYAFQTTEFEMTVTINDDGTWSYDQTTTLNVHGQAKPFLHTDRNTLKRVGKPRPNPLAETHSPPR
jgi:hypothetical protein